MSQHDTIKTKRPRHALEVGTYVLAVLIVGWAVFVSYARFFLANQMELVVPVATSNRPVVAGLDEASYQTVAVLLHDPGLAASLLLSGSVLVRYGLLVIACLLLAPLLRRLGSTRRIFTGASSRAVTIFGVASILLPFVWVTLEAIGTGRALTDG